MFTRRLTLAVTAVAWLAAPRFARAQACCAAPNLVTPARLQRHEAFGAGVQARGRGVFGAFAADGSFAGTSSGDVETEQDLFGAIGVAGRVQVAVVLPFVETRRRAPGLTAWGGGLGDVRASARAEILRDGANGAWPGVALLLGGTFPTGTPPEEARGTLAADATGAGTASGTLGVELERRFERRFVTAAAAVGARAPRTVGQVRQSFGLEVSGLASAGTIVGDEVAVGLFVAASRQGASRDAATGAALPGSALALVTLGAGTTFPVAGGWRALGSLSVDCPVAGLGMNRSAGVGLLFSLLRAWP
jgi:hypothetical protein